MKNTKLNILALALLLPGLSLAAAPKRPAAMPAEKIAPAVPAGTPLKADPAASKVTFLAVGKPSMLKIHGTTTGGPVSDLKLDGAQIKGTVDFDMDKLDTGIELRTRHMKEKYLQVAEHPKAKLTLTEAPVDAALNSNGEKPFKGKLSLHGQEKDVAGTFTAKEGLVLAKFPIKLSEYAIDIPSYLGVTVADSVDVDVELPLKK